jgi:hypothetical protein
MLSQRTRGEGNPPRHLCLSLNHYATASCTLTTYTPQGRPDINTPRQVLFIRDLHGVKY